MNKLDKVKKIIEIIKDIVVESSPYAILFCFYLQSQFLILGSAIISLYCFVYIRIFDILLYGF